MIDITVNQQLAWSLLVVLVSIAFAAGGSVYMLRRIAANLDKLWEKFGQYEVRHDDRHQDHDEHHRREAAETARWRQHVERRLGGEHRP